MLVNSVNANSNVSFGTKVYGLNAVKKGMKASGFSDSIGKVDDIAKAFLKDGNDNRAVVLHLRRAFKLDSAWFPESVAREAAEKAGKEFIVKDYDTLLISPAKVVDANKYIVNPDYQLGYKFATFTESVEKVVNSVSKVFGFN